MPKRIDRRRARSLFLLLFSLFSLLALSGCSTFTAVWNNFNGYESAEEVEVYKVKGASDIREEYEEAVAHLERNRRLDLPEPRTPKALTTEQKLADFDYLYDTIAAEYPFFGVLERLHGVDWRANRDLYRKRIEETTTDDDFRNTIEDILFELHSGHVGVAGRAEVESTMEHYSYYTYMDSIEEEFIGLNSRVVRNRYLLDGMQPNKKSMDEIEGDESLWRRNAVTGDLVKGKIASIRIPEMLSSVEWGYDKKEVVEYLKKVKDYPVLVLDIRGNPGGLMEYWQDFLVPQIADKTYEATSYLFFRDGENSKFILKELGPDVKLTSELDAEAAGLSHPEDLQHFPKYYKETLKLSPATDSIRFKGHIYLLVDKGVYSAAEAFASFSKSSGFATLVGERTGGDGLTMGMLYRYLPNSGYVFTYTNALGYAQDGSINEEEQTTPDIETKDEIGEIRKREGL